MNKMLHLVNKSSFERNALDSCLRLAKTGSSVLFIEDGVYAAMSKAVSAKSVNKRMQDLNFFVLGPDITARGLEDTPLIPGIQVVDYAGFVDLVVEHDVTQSWL